MQYHILGRTGLSVSEIGFGGIPIQKINEKKAVSIIRLAAKHGINFIDTGRAYTDSERKIGLAIKNERSKWIIASKSPAVSYEQMKNDIETSLRELKTDYIDLYQLHHIKSLEMLKDAMHGALKAMKEFRDSKKIKFIGITSHEPSVLEKAIKTGKFDTVMTSFNYYEREAEKLIKECERKNIGVIVMKPLAGGLIRHATSAMRYCLSIDGVSTIIPGIHTESELKADAIDVLKNKKFTNEDKKKLDADKLKQEKYCRQCGYCVTMGDCPRNINIFYFLALEGYFHKFGAKKWIIDLYKKQKVKPDACNYCGHCESVCPYGLPIMRILRDLKIRKYCEKTEKAMENKFGKRNYFEEKKELDDTAKAMLGKRWAQPVVYFKYKRAANTGQRATVLKLIYEFEKHAIEKQKHEAIEKLCAEMKINKQGIRQLKDLAMLADYDNIVDMMRLLPILTKKIKGKKKK